MKQHQAVLNIMPRGRGMLDVTRQVAQVLAESAINCGMLHLFVRHTSCSLLIQENADTDVQTDMERFLSRLVPDGDPIYTHIAEGPDDMPAHVRAALTATSLSIPVADGNMTLGVWQGIYLYEHRQHASRRQVVVHISGM
ncbi:MAG: secondary thiamine-phosphate synthase enzyme YjbQ [Mariprofundaceae bacterium]|nr:secondary thiamine-phosphate synthase enzyme YjbQ [Mariprofundaceae bacterium]